MGADVPKLLRTAFVTSCSAVPTDGANCGLLSFESQWIVVAFTNCQQYDNNLQNKHEDDGGIRRLSDGKVSFSLVDLELKATALFRFRMRTFFDRIRFPFMEEDRGSNFSGEWTISSPKGRRSWLLFRKGGFVSLICNCFLDKDAIWEYLPISSKVTKSVYE